MFLSTSQWVPTMFPMCSPIMFPITSHFNPICLTQSPPYRTWIRLGIIPSLPLFRSCVALNTYATCTWKTMHLMKLQHSNLPRNLELFLTFKWMALKLVANFPSGPRPFHSGTPSSHPTTNLSNLKTWHTKDNIRQIPTFEGSFKRACHSPSLWRCQHLHWCYSKMTTLGAFANFSLLTPWWD
jgi:hypothetical protein